MAASQKILDFFTPERLRILTGSESPAKIEFDHTIKRPVWLKFKNKEVDSLDVKSIGLCSHSDIVVPLTLLNAK